MEETWFVFVKKYRDRIPYEPLTRTLKAFFFYCKDGAEGKVHAEKIMMGEES